MENHFAVRLASAVRRCGNPVLVGLDPRAESLPAGLLPEQDLGQPERVAAAYGEFCRGVIDVVAPLVAVVRGHGAVIFAAGSGSKTGPEKTVDVDQIGAISLIDTCLAENCRRFITLSTSKAHKVKMKRSFVKLPSI